MDPRPPLLCEDCGYDLTGLSAEAKCPECARSVVSVRTQRTGSPWQRKASLASLFATVWVTLTAPRAMYDRVRITRETRWLEWIYRAAAAALVSVPLMLWAQRIPPTTTADPTDWFRWTLTLGMPLVCWVGLSTLTGIERRGLMFFGGQRGWRVTPTVARVICAHAGIGWVIGGSLVALAAWVARTGFGRTLRNSDAAYWLANQVGQVWAAVPIYLAAFGIGLLVFEVLVYVGVRRCRFANPPVE